MLFFSSSMFLENLSQNDHVRIKCMEIMEAGEKENAVA